jgi:hypothetical protein
MPLLPLHNFMASTKPPLPFFHLFTMGEHAVAQLVEALRYKPEGRGFDSLLYQWNFSLT